MPILHVAAYRLFVYCPQFLNNNALIALTFRTWKAHALLEVKFWTALDAGKFKNSGFQKSGDASCRVKSEPVGQ